MTYRLHELDPLDACYKLAKSYPGGVAALAARMGKGHGVLQKKLAGHVDSHLLTLDEFSSIVDLSGSARCPDSMLPLHALCWRHGGAFIQLPDAEMIDDEDFLLEVIHTAKEQGDVIRRIQEALADDGKISGREMEDIEREVQESIAAQIVLLEMVKSKARKDAGPRHG